METLLKYIKNNKYTLLIFAIGTILFAYQLNQVIMYADDYSLGIVSNNGGFKAAGEHFVHNYLHWGGGFTGMVVICILTIGFKMWLPIELILLLSTILLTVKCVFIKDKKKIAVVSLIIWLFYFLININISRETIYWLDGSMAYVLTTFQVLLYTYLIYSRLNYPKKRKKYDYILFPITAFFGGWSAAQSGAIVVLISIIAIAFTQFINKEKVPKFYKYSSILTLIGYCIFFFAPGNSARMTTATIFSKLTFFEKILYNTETMYGMFFDFKNFTYTGMPLFIYLLIVLLIISAYYYIKKEKNEKIKLLLALSCIYNFMFIILAIFYGNSHYFFNEVNIQKALYFKNLYCTINDHSFRIKYLIPYIISTVTILTILIQSIYISLKKKDSILLILVTSAFAAQGVMLMSPSHPFRTTLIIIIITIVAISYLIKLILDKKLDWETMISLVIMIKYLPLGCALLILFKVNNKYLNNTKLLSSKTMNLIATIIILLLFSAYNYINITYNYRINKRIDNENISRIKKYKNNPSKNKILVLKSPKDEIYGYSPMTSAKWLEKDLKKYYKLDKKTQIMSEEEYEDYLNNNNSD